MTKRGEKLAKPPTGFLKFKVVEDRDMTPEEVESLAQLLGSWWIRDYEAGMTVS